jgi:uncharacterized membrane protein
MPIATEAPRRYAGSYGERRVGSYSTGQTWNRRWNDQWDETSGNGAEEGAERRARGLGWFSIGLGLAQIGAPRSLARLIGIDDDEDTKNTMFALGLREITSGIGILARPRAAGWVWSRVGGDLMDLALLGKAMGSDRNDRGRLAAATAAVLGVTVVDYMTGRDLSREGNGGETRRQGRAATGTGGVQVTESITVNRPVQEVYGFWRNFENLPRFMEHLESVRVTEGGRSHWKAKAPAGATVEWDAELVDDRPNESISWRALSDSTVPNSGSVRFREAPGDRGTEITVDLRYQPPGGKLGAFFAKLFGEEPSQQVKSDLRRFKQVLELGEVVHSDASIHRGMHPAQPPEDLSEVNLAGASPAGSR